MTRVEWIESTGDQWIDTGVVPKTSANNVLTIRAAYTGGNAVGCLFGVCQKVSSTGRYFQLNKTSTSEQFRLITSNGDKFYTKASSFYSAAHTYEVRANVLYIDGASTLTGTGTFDSFSKSLFLFARNDTINGQGGLQKGKWRIYSVKMVRNGTTLFDAVPFRDGSEGCLYDLVTRSVLRNAGTGSFLCGTDVAGGGGTPDSRDAPSPRRALARPVAGPPRRATGGPRHERRHARPAPPPREALEARHAA